MDQREKMVASGSDHVRTTRSRKRKFLVDDDTNMAAGKHESLLIRSRKRLKAQGGLTIQIVRVLLDWQHGLRPIVAVVGLE